MNDISMEDSDIESKYVDNKVSVNFTNLNNNFDNFKNHDASS